MKITEDAINHNALRLIDDILADPYSWCYADESDAKKEETRNCMLMAIGNIEGVIDMAKAMKEVLKT